MNELKITNEDIELLKEMKTNCLNSDAYDDDKRLLKANAITKFLKLLEEKEDLIKLLKDKIKEKEDLIKFLKDKIKENKKEIEEYKYEMFKFLVEIDCNKKIEIYKEILKILGGNK